MDVKDLSSNWKRLQQSLKPAGSKPASSSSSSNGAPPASTEKRKARDSVGGDGSHRNGSNGKPGFRVPAPVKRRKVLLETNGAAPAHVRLNGKEHSVQKRKRSTDGEESRRRTKAYTKMPVAAAGKERKKAPAGRYRMGGAVSATAAANGDHASDADSHSSPSPDPDDDDIVPPSTALEDIPASQRLLVSRPSAASLHTGNGTHPLHRPADKINSGLVPGVVAGKYVALDCEMVGVGEAMAGSNRSRSALARASLVNYHGEQIYDGWALPKEAISDYRSAVSGITERELAARARPFEVVQAEVAALLEGRVLVGHAVRNDLDALMLGHPRRDTRDTSRHPPYRALAAGRSPALRRLARDLLALDIQRAEHSSVEDARATMLLYRRDKDAFERENVKRFGVDRRRGQVRKRIPAVGAVGAGKAAEEEMVPATAAVVAMRTKKGSQKEGAEGDDDDDDGDEQIEEDGDETRAGRKTKKKKKKKKRKN